MNPSILVLPPNKALQATFDGGASLAAPGA